MLPNGHFDELIYVKQITREPGRCLEAAAAPAAPNDKKGLSLETKILSSKICLPSAKVNPEQRVWGKELAQLLSR